MKVVRTRAVFENLPDQVLKFLGSHVYSEQELGASIESIWCRERGDVMEIRVQFDLVESHVEVKFCEYFRTRDLLQCLFDSWNGVLFSLNGLVGLPHIETYAYVSIWFLNSD